MPHIRTEARIAAPAEAVWDALADFDRYAEWNPLNVEARGTAALGARIPMVFRNPADRRPGAVMSMTVQVTECERGLRLAWLGRVPLLFSGLHRFSLTPDGGGGVRLVHEEIQTGLVPLTFSRRVIEDGFTPLYAAANRALAARLGAAITEI
jgi:hypothetical protein